MPLFGDRLHDEGQSVKPQVDFAPVSYNLVLCALILWLSIGDRVE